MIFEPGVVGSEVSALELLYKTSQVYCTYKPKLKTVTFCLSLACQGLQMKRKCLLLKRFTQQLSYSQHSQGLKEGINETLMRSLYRGVWSGKISESDTVWPSMLHLFYLFISCSRSCRGFPQAKRLRLAELQVSHGSVCLQKCFLLREEHQRRAARKEQEPVWERHRDPVVSLGSSRWRLRLQHRREFWVSRPWLDWSSFPTCEGDDPVIRVLYSYNSVYMKCKHADRSCVPRDRPQSRDKAEARRSQKNTAVSKVLF